MTNWPVATLFSERSERVESDTDKTSEVDSDGCDVNENTDISRFRERFSIHLHTMHTVFGCVLACV